MTSNCSTALPRSSEFCQIVRIPNDDHDDDNYDCRFVERPNIHGKAMPVALTGEVSLPDKYTKHRQREGWWCSHWFENKWVLSCLWKAEEDSRVSHCMKEGIPESGDRVGESPEAELPFGMVFIHAWTTQVKLRRWSQRLWWFKV